MESELKIMEKDVTDLKSVLTSMEGISQDKLKVCVYMCVYVSLQNCLSE